MLPPRGNKGEFEASYQVLQRFLEEHWDLVLGDLSRYNKDTREIERRRVKYEILDRASRAKHYKEETDNKTEGAVVIGVKRFGGER